jgi:hypothetical protein
VTDITLARLLLRNLTFVETYLLVLEGLCPVVDVAIIQYKLKFRKLQTNKIIYLI